MPQGRARKNNPLVATETYLKGALGIIAVALFAYLGKAYLDGYIVSRTAAEEFAIAERSWQAEIAASGIPAYWVLGSKGYGFAVREGRATIAPGGVVERRLVFTTRTLRAELMAAYRSFAQSEQWEIVETQDDDRLIATTPAGGQVLMTMVVSGELTSVTMVFTIVQ